MYCHLTSFSQWKIFKMQSRLEVPSRTRSMCSRHAHLSGEKMSTTSDCFQFPLTSIFTLFPRSFVTLLLPLPRGIVQSGFMAEGKARLRLDESHDAPV